MTDWKRLLLPAALAITLSGLAPATMAQDVADEDAVVEVIDDAAVDSMGDAEEGVVAGDLAEAKPASDHAQIPFFSLYNTNFVVLISFLVFAAFLIWLKVPGLLGRLLDKRADTIRGELDEARSLREEAQALLASFEKKQKDVSEQVARIVAQAREEATHAADQAREDIARSVARRLVAAEDQIRAAEARALREVRDQAIAVAITASREIIADKMTTAESNRLIDDAIGVAGEKLH